MDDTWRRVIVCLAGVVWGLIPGMMLGHWIARRQAARAIPGLLREALRIAYESTAWERSERPCSVCGKVHPRGESQVN
jgi:uncharacterized protein YneF (UPF0154 family)